MQTSLQVKELIDLVKDLIQSCTCPKCQDARIIIHKIENNICRHKFTSKPGSVSVYCELCNEFGGMLD